MPPRSERRTGSLASPCWRLAFRSHPQSCHLRGQLGEASRCESTSASRLLQLARHEVLANPRHARCKPPFRSLAGQLKSQSLQRLNVCHSHLVLPLDEETACQVDEPED